MLSTFLINMYINVFVDIKTPFTLGQMIPDSSLIRNVLTVYTKEYESDKKLSQIDYESGTFESGNVCRIFVSQKV